MVGGCSLVQAKVSNTQGQLVDGVQVLFATSLCCFAGQPTVGYGLQPNRDYGSRSRQRDLLRDDGPGNVHHHGQRRGRLRHRAHHGLLGGQHHGRETVTSQRETPPPVGRPPVDPRRLRAPPHGQPAGPGVLGQQRDQRAEVRRGPGGDHGLRATRVGSKTSRSWLASTRTPSRPGQRAGVTAFVTNRNGQPLAGKMVQFSTERRVAGHHGRGRPTQRVSSPRSSASRRPTPPTRTDTTVCDRDGLRRGCDAGPVSVNFGAPLALAARDPAAVPTTQRGCGRLRHVHDPLPHAGRRARPTVPSGDARSARRMTRRGRRLDRRRPVAGPRARAPTPAGPSREARLTQYAAGDSVAGMHGRCCGRSGAGTRAASTRLRRTSLRYRRA